MTQASAQRPAPLHAAPEGGTRGRLVRAAAEVIQKGGWGSASVGAIARRAGVAAGTLYRHFPSKAELFLEVFRTVSERELAAMSTAQAAVTGVAERFATGVSPGPWCTSRWMPRWTSSASRTGAAIAGGWRR